MLLVEEDVVVCPSVPKAVVLVLEEAVVAVVDRVGSSEPEANWVELVSGAIVVEAVVEVSDGVVVEVDEAEVEVGEVSVVLEGSVVNLEVVEVSATVELCSWVASVL